MVATTVPLTGAGTLRRRGDAVVTMHDRRRRLAGRPAHGSMPVQPAARGRRTPSGEAAAMAVMPLRRLPSAVYWRRRFVLALLVLVMVAGAFLAGGRALEGLGGGPLTAAGAGTPAPAGEAAASSSASEVGSSGAGSAATHSTARTIRLDAEPVSRRTYVVRSGDTLWTIARHIQPDGDVRPLVDALAAARDGRPLQPGERVVVPLGS